MIGSVAAATATPLLSSSIIDETLSGILGSEVPALDVQILHSEHLRCCP